MEVEEGRYTAKIENLAKETKSEDLVKLFSECGKILDCKVDK